MSADRMHRGGKGRNGWGPHLWAALLSVLGLVVVLAMPPLSTADAVASTSEKPGTPIGTLLATLSDPGTNDTDNFGYTAALSGDTLVVGSTTNYPEGRVAYLYTKGASGWPSTPTITLNAPGGPSNNLFGRSVSISGNTLVVGARGPDTGGDAFIYTKGVSGWPTTPTVTLKDPEANDEDDFGAAAVSGNTIVVSADGAGAGGVVYIYTDGPSGWPTAPTVTLNNPGSSTDQFDDVAVSGTTIVVGAVGDTGASLVDGPAYIYTEGPTAPTVTLHDPAENPSDQFPTSVAVWGKSLVISATSSGSNRGVSYDYQMGATGWPQRPQITLKDPAATDGDAFGDELAVSTSSLVVTAVGPNPGGVAYLYKKAASGWHKKPKATMPDPAAPANDGFGNYPSVEISDNALVVGAPGDGGGVVYIYKV
jgi:hypothetical protein